MRNVSMDSKEEEDEADTRPLVIAAEGEGNNRHQLSWLERAKKSPCALALDEVFVNKEGATAQSRQAVEELKSAMFLQLYQLIGREIFPEDIERALVVRNQKFHPWVACIFTFFTCGLFHIFRPRDDSTILVLTKEGRVYSLKVERPSMFGATYWSAIFKFLSYMLVLSLCLTLPWLVYFQLGPEMKDKIKHIDDEVKRKIMKSAVYMGVLCGCFACVLAFWLYTNWPLDICTHVRQSQAAQSVSAVQFCLTGSYYRRQAVLRLFFGRYPTQAVMDASGLATGCIMGPVDKSVLVAARASKRLTPAFLTILTLVVSFVTILDSCFSWYDRSVAIAHYVEVREFCVHVNSDNEVNEHSDKVGRKACHKNACEEWAAANNITSPSCGSVHWYNNSNAGKDQWECLVYHRRPPCCSGCTNGETQDFQRTRWIELIRGVVEVIGDVGTIVFSIMVARVAVATDTPTDSIDVVIKKSARYVRQTSNFGLIHPLALHFVESVFRFAWTDLPDLTPEDLEPEDPKPETPDAPAPPDPDSKLEDSQDPKPETHEAPAPAPPDHDSKLDDSQVASGILNFIETEDAVDWDAFFRQGNTVAMLGATGSVGCCNYATRVNVPKVCLGIGKKEPVLGAWIEMPRMTFMDVLPHLCVALLVLMAMLMWPHASAEKFARKMGLGIKYGVLRLITSLVAAIGYFVCASAIHYFCLFRQVEHAVIVTNLRVFYVRHRRKCLGCYGMDVRVDIFRHDSEVFYGRMDNLPVPFWYRCMGVRWMPGQTYMQVRFGVLQMIRRHGDALAIYHVISKLSSKSKGRDCLTEENLREAGVDWNECRATLQNALVKRASGKDKDVEIWDVVRQADDIVESTPDIAMRGSADGAEKPEQPVYHWSFKDIGTLQAPYHVNTDVIVTTDRIFLWSRPIYKPFDCKLICCYGMCWCACINKCLQGKRLPNSMSFLSLKVLLSFSTEVSVDPPVWVNPNHMPLKVPLFSEICEALTRCITCQGCCRFDFSKCSLFPRRQGPRKQINMLWRLRYNAQQDDLMTVIKPYQGDLDVDEEAGFFESLGCACGDMGCCNNVATYLQQGSVHTDTEKIAMLRKIMAIAQEAAG